MIRLGLMIVALLILATVVGGGKLTYKGQPAFASVPSAMVIVPLEANDDLLKAYATMHRAGLIVGIQNSFTLTSFCMPVVGWQIPRPGTIVPRGTAVSIHVGFCHLQTLFPVVRTSARVPEFMGQPLTRVVHWAQRHRLYWQARKLPRLPASNRPRLTDNYRVITQAPAPGNTLRPGVLRLKPNQGSFLPTPVVVTGTPRD